MRVSVSPEINQLLERAASLSVRRGHYFVGVEHLFESVVNDAERLPADYGDPYVDELNKVLRIVERSPWPGRLPGAVREVFYTPRCANTLNEAARLASRLGSAQAKAGHLLLALLADAHSTPSRVMDERKFDRGAHVSALENALAGQGRGETAASKPACAEAANRPIRGEHAGDSNDSPDAHEAEAVDGLDQWSRDLTAMAREGKIEPAIGRDSEIMQLLEITARKNKNNAILVGDAGVGKTKVAEGLALAMATGELGAGFQKYRIVELNLGALMAGTQYRGAFEERLNKLLGQLKSDPHSILFIDEIHLIMGAGSTEGGGLDLANLIKPALARGELRCIGATTLEEYRRFISKDAAMERRFQMVRVEALSIQATYAVLKSMRPSLQEYHGVRISKRALRASILLSQRYLPNRNLPDKAIDVIDQASARYRLKLAAVRSHPEMLDGTTPATPDGKVTPHDVQKVISRMTSIPLEEINQEERRRISGLDQQLKKAIIGQDEAVNKIAATVKRFRAGLNDPERPDAVLLFLGPTGVGKTQMAKALAYHVFGSKTHLVTFDMTEYTEQHSVSRLLGAPPGYVGYEEEGRLSDALSRHPYSILLFDEIEKAHSKVFDVFLPILDEGRVKDSRGRDLSFRNNLIIFTSNIGSDLLERGHGETHRRELLEALYEHFRPEFINRIDDIIPFFPLLPEDIRQVLAINLKTVRKRIRDKGFDLHVYQGAYEYLAEKGYSAEFGARELRRVVDRLVVTPLSAKILEGHFRKGDRIEVKMADGALTFEAGMREATGRSGAGK